MRSGALLDQHTLAGFTALGFFLPFYVIQYHAWRNDAVPGGVLCDIPLYFVIRAYNKIESVIGSTDRAANKTHVHDFGVSLNNISVDYSFCCGIVRLQGY